MVQFAAYYLLRMLLISRPYLLAHTSFILAATTPCALSRSGNMVLHEPDRLAFGGDKEIRTLDPLRARQVLSQLSYIPMFLCRCFIYRF